MMMIRIMMIVRVKIMIRMMMMMKLTMTHLFIMHQTNYSPVSLASSSLYTTHVNILDTCINSCRKDKKQKQKKTLNICVIDNCLIRITFSVYRKESLSCELSCNYHSSLF